MSKHLFIGSSLTFAFKQWDDTQQDSVQRDFFANHGGYWIPSFWCDSKPPVIQDETKLLLAKNIRIKTHSGDVQDFPVQKYDAQFYSHDADYFAIDFDAYDRVFITVPMLYRDVSYNFLYCNGYGLLSDKTHDLFIESNLLYPLTTEMFLLIHKTRFQPVYKLFEFLTHHHPNVSVFITPSIMPGKQQNQYTVNWRKLHNCEQAILAEYLESQFSCSVLEQPSETVIGELYTDSCYMRDLEHHFNEAFVDALHKSYDCLL